MRNKSNNKSNVKEKSYSGSVIGMRKLSSHINKSVFCPCSNILSI